MALEWKSLSLSWRKIPSGYGLASHGWVGESRIVQNIIRLKPEKLWRLEKNIKKIPKKRLFGERKR